MSSLKYLDYNTNSMWYRIFIEERMRWMGIFFHSDWSKLVYGDETLFLLLNALLVWYVTNSIQKNVHSLSRVSKPVSYRSLYIWILFSTTATYKKNYLRVIKKRIQLKLIRVRRAKRKKINEQFCLGEEHLQKNNVAKVYGNTEYIPMKYMYNIMYSQQFL